MCFELPWLDSRRRRVVFAQNLVAHCPGRCGFAPFLAIAANDAASNHFFCAARIFAQRALAALLIAALAEALIVNFFWGVGLAGVAGCLTTQRRCWAAAIFARVAALTTRLTGVAVTVGTVGLTAAAGVPRTVARSVCSFSICALIAAAWLSWLADRSDMFMRRILSAASAKVKAAYGIASLRPLVVAKRTLELLGNNLGFPVRIFVSALAVGVWNIANGNGLLVRLCGCKQAIALSQQIGPAGYNLRRARLEDRSLYERSSQK